MGKPKLRPSDQPLVVRLEGQHLVIRIGIATLNFCSLAQNGGPLLYGLRVIHGRQWAKDVVCALLKEDEDGTTLTTAALERAMVAACNDGSAALRYPAGVDTNRKEGD